MIIKVKPSPFIGGLDIDPIIVYVTSITERSAKLFSDQMNRAVNSGQPFIPLVINSFGGDIYALMSMIDTIEACGLPLLTVVEGKAMSCGAVLFTFGHPGMRWMGEHATLMLHDAMAFNAENSGEKAHEAQSSTAELTRLNEQLWEIMERNIKKKKGFLSKKAHAQGRSNLYINAETAVAWGLASDIGIPQWHIEVEAVHKIVTPSKE